MTRGHRPAKIVARTGIAVAVLSLLAVTVAFALNGQAASRSVGRRPTSETSTMSVAASIPANYSPIQQLVGDPTSSGAWFWSYSTTQDTIFHESTTGVLASWNVLTTNDAAESGTSGLAVSSSGSVWLGINSTLVELDPRSGDVQSWSVPAPSANPAERALTPPNEAIPSSIMALAVNSTDSEVAVALSGSSAVVTFEPQTSQFQDVSLPVADDQAISLAFASDGTLGIGYSDLADGGQSNDVLLISNSDGSTTSVSVGAPGTAWTLTALPGVGFAAGTTHPVAITTRGTVSALNVPSSLVGPGSAPTPLAVLPNGKVAGVASAGVVLFPTDAASVTAADNEATLTSAPDVSCSGGVGAEEIPGGSDGVTNDSGQPNGMCSPPNFRLLASDGSGDLWVVPPTETRSVALFSAVG
jgi:hypothetical protein